MLSTVHKTQHQWGSSSCSSRPSLPHLTRFLITVVMEKRQGSYSSWLNLIFDKFVGLKKIREREAVPYMNYLFHAILSQETFVAQLYLWKIPFRLMHKRKEQIWTFIFIICMIKLRRNSGFHDLLDWAGMPYKWLDLCRRGTWDGGIECVCHFHSDAN